MRRFEHPPPRFLQPLPCQSYTQWNRAVSTDTQRSSLCIRSTAINKVRYSPETPEGSEQSSTPEGSEQSSQTLVDVLPVSNAPAVNWGVERTSYQSVTHRPWTGGSVPAADHSLGTVPTNGSSLSSPSSQDLMWSRFEYTQWVSITRRDVNEQGILGWSDLVKQV